MKTNEEKLITDISAKTPTLSPSEKAALWSKVEAELPTTPVVSPYSFFTQFKKQSAPIALALVALLSTTGLVAASEPARPGDSLFTIDQSIENIRLALASDNEKTRLEAEFAAERLIELSSVLEEALLKNQTKKPTSTSTGDIRVSDALAVTLSYFGSARLSNDTKDDLYADLAAILEGTPIKLDDERLRLLNEDTKIEVRSDDSRNDGRIEISDGENRMRIREKDGGLRIQVKGNWDEDEEEEEDRDEKNNHKTGSKNDQADERDNEDDKYRDQNDREEEVAYDQDNSSDFDLEAELDSDLFTDDSRTRDDDSDEDRLEDDSEADRTDDVSDQNDDSVERLKVEVEVEDGFAHVRLEQASEQTEFSLPYITKAALVTAIALKTDLTESAISGALDLEFKD